FGFGKRRTFREALPRGVPRRYCPGEASQGRLIRMNMQQMLKQAQKMQEQMQKQMETTVVDATAGGGMVYLKMNGKKELISVQIDPEVFSSGDKEMLQDLIVAAVNEGIRKVEDVLAGQFNSLGMKIPGLF